MILALPAPFVSVTIPAYREGQRLPGLLKSFAAAAVNVTVPIEIVVVDDGSSRSHRDAERVAAQDAARALVAAGAPHRVRFEGLARNEGKGAAVRHGWRLAHAHAEWLGFLDADGAIGAAEFLRLVEMLPVVECDVLAGSRIRMAGRRIERRLSRHLQGRVFATLADNLFRLGFYDTQCGCKMFRASVLRPHVARLQERAWLLDLELLALLASEGARFREEPIDWSDPGGTKVRPFVDALGMAFGALRLRARVHRSRAVPPCATGTSAMLRAGPGVPRAASGGRQSGAEDAECGSPELARKSLG